MKLKDKTNFYKHVSTKCILFVLSRNLINAEVDYVY